MRIVLWIVLVVCIIAAGIFGYLLFSEIIVDMQSQSFFNNMVSDIEFRPRDGIQGSGDTIGDGGGGGDGSEWMDGMTREWIPFIDFDALNERYPGIVGWILLDDSPINFPIMQHANNNSFFLTHLPDGSRNRSGSIYLDYRNASDFSDEIMLIFGHHFSQSDAMFSYLRNYRRQEFFDANPIIHIFTPYADYEMELFAAVLAHAVHDHPPLEFENEEEFLQYVRYIRGRSIVRSDLTIYDDDRIVALVTCQRDFAGDQGRLIVFGRMVRVAGIDPDGIGAPS